MTAREFIIAPENAGKSIVEIMQLYSDQQNKDKDAEIQRLTKEVEELKLKLSGKTFFNPFEQENTLLRELLGKTSGGLSNLVFTAGKLWDDVKPIKDSDAITVTHPIIEEAKKLVTEIDNALNHKP